MSHAQRPIDRVLAIMARLRHPAEGCPWDVAQSFATIAPYTIEEAYEVADAIDCGDMPALREELGDLLFQVVFHARMAEEAGHFDFDNVAAALADKMVERHPHVFAAAERRDAGAQIAEWEAAKAEERARKRTAAGAQASTLDDVALGYPALMRAQKIQKRASRVGFDWADPGPALDKVAEEIAEIRPHLATPASAELVDEIGDLLFAVVNVARLAEIDAEAALRAATLKFERRFRAVERKLSAAGKRPETSTLAEMDALWDVVKAEERGA
jgi:MazG family protein